jgi:hypothetical protein
MRNQCHKLVRQKGLSILKGILPKQKIQEIARQEYPQERKRALTSVLYIGLLIFAQIQRSIGSVDELLEMGLGQVGKIYGLKGMVITKQSFSRRSKTLPWQMCKRLYEYLIEVASQMKSGREKLFHDIYTVKLLDSTILDVAARLIGVMASKPTRRFQNGKTNKGQIKITTIFNWSGRIPELIQLKKGLNGELSTIKGWLRKAIKRSKTVILVFDLGFLSYQFIDWLIKEKIYFVSRIKSNNRYEVIKKLGRNDWLVRIGITAKSQKSSLVRLVRVKEKKRWYYYITTLMDCKQIKRKDIRLLYRYRWQIEIFFKELKHILNIKKIFFYNPNGIKGQIYIALSVYVLGKILIAQSAQKYEVKAEDISFSRAITAIRIWVTHNDKRVFCERVWVKLTEDLLDQIYIFAHIKKKRLNQANEVTKSSTTNTGKIPA